MWLQPRDPVSAHCLLQGGGGNNYSVEMMVEDRTRVVTSRSEFIVSKRGAPLEVRAARLAPWSSHYHFLVTRRDGLGQRLAKAVWIVTQRDEGA